MPSRDRTAIPAKTFTISDTQLTDIIAPNFQVYELVKSDLAVRLGINNWFRLDSQLVLAVVLTRAVLQPIRNHFGKFTPNSVYRSQALERALKGKPSTWRSKSQHAAGQAADIEVVGISTLQLAKWVKEYIDFDQLIMEMYTQSQPNSGWVHVSYREGNNRGEVLSYVKSGDGYIYVPGLVG